ncbi:leucine-rich repeat and WD repeat-containing protein 1 isoform X2 [Alligator mississippiensis]|uniref:leucine-rich repeat and WD repeat-containing protein 1 isoform X2 n=1 Tax=Alligator mississippiensis TaxID=8496 RepID=UPI000906F7D1|nr:leucine-rich repeat and WD repeat-containing protein 1 isoform X2 [Alligator mississippiensis]
MSKITTELLLERAVPRSTRLRKIETLNLSKLQLKTGDLDPRLFSRLRHLQKLDISDNELVKFPNSLTLPELRVLNCSNNQLDDVTTLKQFPKLEELSYENNTDLTRNDDHKVIFLLQNLRLLNGKDVTKLADHVRQINSQKLTSKVTTYWEKNFRDQLPKDCTAEDVKAIRKKFLKSVQTHVIVGPSSLREFTRWRVKTIAEELLVSLLGQEENTNPELEERMDDEEEEENTESSGEVMEEVDQVISTPSKRKGNRSQAGSGNKRPRPQPNPKEIGLSPRKSSHLQDEPTPEKPRASNQKAKVAKPGQGAEGTQRNGEQLPKGQSHRRSSQLAEQQKSQEQDKGVVSLTPVKDLEGEDVILEPLHFLQCHSKSNSREDFKTQLWSCAFEPLLDGGTRKDPIVSSSRTVATCGGEAVCLIDCETGIVLKKYKVPAEEFFTVAWTTLTMVNKDNRKRTHNILAAAGRRGIVKLIHVTADFCYGEIKAHKKPIATACFSTSCETHLFTASYDKRIALWDIGVPDCDYNFKASQLLVMEAVSVPLRIALVPSCPDQYLLAGCEDGCFAWDIRVDRPQKNRPFEVTFQFPDEDGEETTSHRVDGLAFLNKDVVAKEYVFCGDENGSVWMYNLSNHSTWTTAARRKRSDKSIAATQILKWPELRANGEVLTDVLINNVITDPTFTYLVALTSVNIAAIWKKT